MVGAGGRAGSGKKILCFLLVCVERCLSALPCISPPIPTAMHRSQPRKKEKVERTAEEEEDEDEEDPFDRRIRESGCSAQHYALQVGWLVRRRPCAAAVAAGACLSTRIG